MADEAAFLIGKQAAAVGALPGYVPGQARRLRLMRHLNAAITAAAAITLDMFFQDAGDGIGTGKHCLALLPGDGRTADALELLYHRGNIYSGPECQGDKTADSFKLSRGTAPGFAQGGENLAYPLFI